MFRKMNAREKQLVKRLNAGSLIAILLFTTILSANIFMGGDHKVYAAESSAMGTNSYSTGITGGAALSVGTTYTLGGNAKTGGTATPQAQVLAVSGNFALMQSTGLWGGVWPGEGELSSTAAAYFGDLKAAISDVYLPRGTSANTETVYWQGTWSNSYASIVHSILASAAANYSTFGASNNYAWLGTADSSSYAYSVHSGGSFYNYYTGYSRVCAPAFTIDTSKVSLSGSTLTYATFTDSTSITAAQSVTSVEEGASVDLSRVITGVVYNGGDNNGKSASYTVAISTNDGAISGTTWTAPTGINSNRTVTLTIRDTVKNLTATKSVTVVPRAARSIAIEKSGGFPEFVTVGDTIDLSSYITVTGYDSGTQLDGTITNYSVSVNSAYGTTTGTLYTPANISSTKDISLTVTPIGPLGSVDYSKMSAAFTIKVKPDTTGWTDRDDYTDELGFHTYTDPATEITWKYRYNNDGYILYLYTEDDVASIISDGHVLLVPSSINGVSVVGIGGGSKDGTVIPFIPSTGNNVNNTWTSIYIPTSVKIINDGAFYQNGAAADIVIPGNVSDIGVNAFKESKITSVTFNDANSLILNTESFADIASLGSVSIRGNGVTMKQRVFANDTGLTQIDIPNGTKFKGETDQNDSFAFQGTTGLTLIKIDTETVYSNTFSANKNLAKVIFGENVTRVKYDWSGTAATNSETLGDTVARATYALNADTIFEMDKTTGGSPFGYANMLTVVGKNRSLDDDNTSYNNTSDPVTAKIAYLAHYYTTNNEVKGYAKGTGSDITITAEGEPAEDDGVTSTISDSQTGIEAYYTGIIFSGKKLEKDKTTVYKMYGDKQNGTYDASEFYVLRTTDADELLSVDNTNQKNAEDVYVTTYTDDVLAAFGSKDDITITDSDVLRGTVDVKVVVLLKDAEGDILVDHSNGHVIAYSYAVAIPVKEYTAENDFLENYGSYSAVISKIDDLLAQVANLTQTVSDKDSEIATLTGEKDELQEQYDMLVADKTDDEETIAALNSQLAEKTTALTAANNELNDCKAQLVEYAAAYNNLIEELKKYISDTDTDNTGYFGTITITDAETGEQTENEVVYIGGNPYDYEKTNETVTIGLNDYTIYTGTGDLNGDGIAESFKFIVTNDGVTILVEVDDGEGGTAYIPAETYTDTIGAIQRKAAAQLAAVSAELEELKVQITDLDEQLSVLRGQISALNAQVSLLEAENEQLKEDKGELEKANEALQKELDELKAANAAALEEANAKAEELRTQLAEQQAAAKAAQEALQDENASTEEKLAAAQVQINALNTNVTTLQETNASLQESLAAANVHVSTLETEAEQYVATLTTIANTMSADATDPEDIIAKVQAQAATIEEIKTALGTDNVSELVPRIENIVAAADGDMTALQTQITTLTDEKTVLTAKVAQLTKDLEDAQVNAGSSEADAKTIADLKAANATLTSENRSLTDKVASLTTQLSSALAGTGTSSDSAAIKALNNTISTLTGSNNSLQTQVSNLTSANTALTTQLSSVKERVASLESENSSLISENKELKTSNSALASDLATVQKSLDSTSDKVKTLKSGNKKLTSENTNLTKKNSTLSSENSALKTQVANLTKQLSSAKAASNSGSGAGASISTAPTYATHTTTASTKNETTTAVASSNTVESSKSSSGTSSVKSEKVDDGDKDSENDDVSVSGGTSILPSKKGSNAAGDTITMPLPGEVDVDDGLITALSDVSLLDMITTNGASISETTADEKEHANEFFRYYAANIPELIALGVEGISEDSGTLAIEGIASIDIAPSDEQKEAISNGKKATVEIYYSGLEDGEDYLIIHESMKRVGSYDVQVVTAEDGALIFDLSDLSPVSFAHVNKNAVPAVTVSSTLTGEENADVVAEPKTEKSNRGIIILLVVIAMIVAMGGFIAFSVIRARKGGSTSGNFFRSRSRA